MRTRADKAAFLYKKYSRLMLKLALRKTDDLYLAEDAVSHTFERVIQRIDTIDTSDEKQTGALLLLMCGQAVVDMRRKTRRVIGILLAEPPSGATEKDEVENEVLQQYEWEDIRRSLSWLPDIYLDPFLYHHLGYMPIAEIAERLAVPEETIRTRMRRAKAKLKERYIRNGGKLFEQR